MQLSQSPLDKRPSYDAIQGANVTPTTFYNIGDLEIQDNLGRVWYVANLELRNCYKSFAMLYVDASSYVDCFILLEAEV